MAPAPVRFLAAGSDAVLVEVEGLDAALALHASLRAEPLEGVTELVPAARTVLLRYRPEVTSAAHLAEQVRSRPLTLGAAEEGPLVTIPVHYDGEDLPEVARLCGLDDAEVVRAHTAATHRVAFTGFAPGFAYQVAEGSGLLVPRRTSPRPRVPAGAVGLAGEFSGVYPRASPGGWQLVGRTDVPVWDLAREVPALLQPGMRVRFADADAIGASDTPAQGVPVTIGVAQARPVREGVREGTGEEAGGASGVDGAGRALEVLSPGAASVLEDLGRPGRAGLGVSCSGAMDHGALRRADRLVGNASDAPALEVAGGGLRVRARGALVLAVAGAPAPVTVRSADGRSRRERTEAAFAVDDGDEVALGAPPRGTYSYLAVRGSFAVEPVLGSASADVLAGIGPGPLRSGDVLAVAAGTAGRAVGAVAVDTAPPPPPAPGELTTVDVLLGPRADWFTADSLARLTAQEWRVTPQSNRVGLRLHGDAPLERAVDEELPSEGAVSGALQVPPSGQPVLFMADHPLTGGYPVVACVAVRHLDLVAQVPVGGRLRFRVVASPLTGPIGEDRP